LVGSRRFLRCVCQTFLISLSVRPGSLAAMADHLAIQKREREQKRERREQQLRQTLASAAAAVAERNEREARAAAAANPSVGGCDCG
jgi:hypothetical protein